MVRRGRPRFTGRKEYFGAVCFDHATAALYPFDPMGAALIEALARHPMADVADAFSTVLEAGREGVRAFVDEWSGRGLLSEAGQPDLAWLPDRAADGYLSAPLRMYVDFTSACNLRCRHCVTRSGRRRAAELDTPSYLKALDVMAEAGVFEINVGGGEPLVRPDAVDLLRHACDLGMSVALVTNGTRVTTRLAEALGGLPLRYVAVSLDGATPETHDAIRGPGRFVQAMRGLRLMAEATSLPLNIHFTLMRHNLHELEDFFRLAEDAPVHSLGILPVRPSGRARDHAALHLSPEEYRHVVWRLQSLSQTSVKPLYHVPFTPGAADEGGSSRMYRGFGCGAAQVACSMDSLGFVTPCNFFGDPGPRQSILERGLLSTWREGPFFRRLRALAGNPKCLACQWFEDCRGGCRAQAVGSSGDLDAPDCYCLL